MSIFGLAIYLGLVRASRYYNQSVCASVWAIGHFASGLLSGRPFLRTVVSSLIAYAVAWTIFKYVRETQDTFLWLLITGLGGAALVWFF